jgi:hypothetical protein
MSTWKINSRHFGLEKLGSRRIGVGDQGCCCGALELLKFEIEEHINLAQDFR